MLLPLRLLLRLLPLLLMLIVRHTGLALSPPRSSSHSLALSLPSSLAQATRALLASGCDAEPGVSSLGGGGGGGMSINEPGSEPKGVCPGVGGGGGLGVSAGGAGTGVSLGALAAEAVADTVAAAAVAVADADAAAAAEEEEEEEEEGGNLETVVFRLRLSSSPYGS